MAHRITHCVLRGEIDNQVPGIVTGRIWLAGRREPVELRLEGDCMRDLAGCRLEFRNPEPQPHAGSEVTIQAEQNGVAGHMTASRRVKVFEDENDYTSPTRWANCLYLEWFSDFNGRVVVEAPEFLLKIGEPMWRMGPEEEAEQLRRVEGAELSFLTKLVGGLPTADEYTIEDLSDPLESAGSEFEDDPEVAEALRLFEAHVKEQYPYRSGEDASDDLDEFFDIGELGDEGGDADADGEASHYVLDEFAWESLMREVDQSNPEPEEEYVPDTGRDHPLAVQLRKLSEGLDASTRAGVLKGEAAEAAKALASEVRRALVKVATALNDLPAVPQEAPEPGFTVASLKRSLAHLHEALRNLERTLGSEGGGPAAKSWFHWAQSELFEVRREVLNLMDYYRRQI
ncbi:MAG: hypothetical protein R3F11_05455 [Verrucomicrobiales bacterium]